MNAPLVSVVLPTRNRAELLRRSLGSVLAQTHRDFELIVVDDASDDGTPALLAALSDPRVRVLRRERNAGAAAARNAGIALARGELLAFQDDDDIWLRHKLETQVRALAASPDAALCLAGHVRMTPVQTIYIGGERFMSQLDFSRGNWIGGPNYSLIATPGWLVRRSVLERVGTFDERLRSWDDWELGLRITQVARHIVVDEPLYVQDHVRGSAMMRAERAQGRDMEIIMQKHGPLWAGKRGVLARHHYVIGRPQSLYEPAPAGRSALWRSLRLAPWRPMTWAALAMAYLHRDAMQNLTTLRRRFRSSRL